MSKPMQDDLNPFRPEDEPQVRPLGVGDFSETDSGAFASTEPKKRLRSSTIIIAVVVLAAVGGLYSMRSLSRAAAGAGGDASLEATIEGFLASLSGNEKKNGENPFQVIKAEDEEKALAALTDDRTDRQVDLREVQKNPFVLLDQKREEATPEKPVQNDDEAKRREELARKRKMFSDTCDRASRNLRLMMVLRGSNPSANISGKVVYAGDTLTVERDGVTFTVESIDEYAVVLMVTDAETNFTYRATLTMNNR